jgi:hypothetical protein
MGLPENHKIPLTPIRYNVQQPPLEGIELPINEDRNGEI